MKNFVRIMVGNFPECSNGTNPEKPNENKTKSRMEKISFLYLIIATKHQKTKCLQQRTNRRCTTHNEIAVSLTTDFSTAVREVRASRVSSTG